MLIYDEKRFLIDKDVFVIVKCAFERKGFDFKFGYKAELNGEKKW